jgi:hypothetical protein
MGTKMVPNLLREASKPQCLRGLTCEFRGHKWAQAAGGDCYFLLSSLLTNSRTTFV